MSEPSYITLGLKSLFRKKKKRKAYDEPKIYPETNDNHIETIEEKRNPEDDRQFENPPSSNPQSTEENNLEQQPKTQIDAEPAVQIEEKPEKDDQSQPKIESPPPVESPATNSQIPETKTDPEDANEPRHETNAELTSTNVEIEPENKSSPTPNVPTKQTQIKKLSGKISSIRPWINKRKQKNEHERTQESSILKYLTFLITALTMALGMTYLPILPQPLPLLLAILVAFLAFRNPRFGMPIGGGIIGLGLIFHLSELYFFSFLGAEEIRVAIVAVWMTLFIALPIIFGSYKSALAVDLGILAFAMLFSTTTFFLAIPLILASAVYFRKYVSLSIIYYVLLTVPLQIVQYFEYTVKPILRPDWWLEAGSSPPIFTSLNSISADINSAVTQFRLYDVSKVFYDITGQMTWVPNYTGRNLADALTQYLDSFPGIMLFITIVGGLAFILLYFSKALTSQGGPISLRDKLLLVFTATISGALFFVFLSILQLPLAYTADVTTLTFILAPIATLLLCLPVVFVDFTPKQTATNLEVKEKAQKLLEKLASFQDTICNVKNKIPINLSSLEGKLIILSDLVQEIIQKCEKHFYDVGEVNAKFIELDKLNQDSEELEKELENILFEYQIYVNGEFSNWIGKFRELGIPVKTKSSEVYHREMAIDEKTQAIQKTLTQAKDFTNEVIDVAESIYKAIKELYEPSLPEQSKTILFAKERLEQTRSPWVAMQATYNAIHNWNHQYGPEFSSSTKYLLESSLSITNMDIENPDLSLGNGAIKSKVQEYIKTVEKIRCNIENVEKKYLIVSNAVSLRNDIQMFLQQTNAVLSLLYSRLIVEEEAIEQSLPMKDYPWNKNISLANRLKKATEMLKNQKKTKTNQILGNLSIFLSAIDETIQTLTIYRDEKEFLQSQIKRLEESKALVKTEKAGTAD